MSIEIRYLSTGGTPGGQRFRTPTPILIASDDDADSDDERGAPRGQTAATASVTSLPYAPIAASAKWPAGLLNRAGKRRKMDGWFTPIQDSYETDSTISAPMSRILSPIESDPEADPSGSPGLAAVNVGSAVAGHNSPPRRKLEVHTARRIFQRGIDALNTEPAHIEPPSQPSQQHQQLSTTLAYMHSKSAELEHRPAQRCQPDSAIVVNPVGRASSSPTVDVEAMLTEFQNQALSRRKSEVVDFGAESEYEDVLSDDDDDTDIVTIGDRMYYDGGFGEVQYCSSRYGTLEVGLEMESITELRSYTDGFKGANFCEDCDALSARGRTYPPSPSTACVGVLAPAHLRFHGLQTCSTHTNRRLRTYARHQKLWRSRRATE